MTSFGAVILSFGHERRFLGLLAEVTAVIDRGDVVVAHNPYSSEDVWLPEVPEGVGLIGLPDNIGYGRAMNAGIGALASDWVMLLTHDAQLDRDQLRLLLGRCEALPPDVGVAGPSLRFPDGTRSFGSDIDKHGWVSHRTVPPMEGAVADVSFVDGSAMLVRRDAWRAIGGLCTRYFMYFEEADLSDRARLGGWRTVLLTDVQLRSAPGSAGRPAAYGFLYARNGYDWARRLRSPKVARSFALAQVRHVRHSLPYRRGRLRPSVAMPALALSVGRLLGLAAAMTGRVNGRPPGYLTSRSDIDRG